MNIRKEVETLKSKGFAVNVVFSKGSWMLYEQKGARVEKTALGKENVENRIAKIKSEL